MRKYLELLRLMRNEYKPLEKIRQEQAIKLRRLLKHAYEHVPFYYEHFNKAGIKPDDIRSIDDIQLIPIIKKQDIFRAGTENFLDKRIHTPDDLAAITTSGTSGQVLSFYIDNGYDQLRKAQFLRPYISNGQGLFDKVFWLRAVVNTHKTLHQKFGVFNERQISASADVSQHIRDMQDFEPDILRGYGSALQLMTARAQENGIELHQPNTVFTDSELLTQDIRSRIEQGFGCDVIDVYGSFETENIAYECKYHQGYHMAIDCAIIEIIKDGKVVKEGETGELVFTMLDNHTFPFIRYNIGDLASFSGHTCDCGRSFPLMDISAGRVFDYAVLNGGKKVSSTILLGHLKLLWKYIQEYQVLQEAVSQFVVQIVPTREYDSSVDSLIIENLLHDLPNAEIRVQPVDRIQRESSGKLKAFKSLLRVDERVTAIG